jgi:alpha-amylase
MMRLSRRVHERLRARPRDRRLLAARERLWQGQANDAYWHGVFGGLYLPHLRDAIWRELARAEAELRRGKRLAWEVVDFDADGHPEIWVHSGSFSAVLSPVRGASLEEYTVFTRGINYANVLTRRREAYHDLALERAAASSGHGDGGTASIHDIEEGIRLEVRPPLDQEDRALLVDRMLPASLDLERYASGDYPRAHSWARVPFDYAVERKRSALEIACTAGGDGVRLSKLIRLEAGGDLSVRYAWDPGMTSDEVFSTELSVAGPLTIDAPDGEIWQYPIETIAKSERGLDRTRQGESLTVRWPARRGEASLVVRPA